MNWRSLDLNLLVVFDAVARARSATRAAAQLNMTQSAISHALGRLRGSLGDELFVRTPDGMNPTPYAERLTLPVREALLSLESAVRNLADFDPSTASGRFVVTVDNRCALVLAAPMAALAAVEAPNLVLDLRPSGTLDVVAHLDGGTVQLALGGHAATGERFNDRLIFEDRFVALVRRDHPAGQDTTISIDALASHAHLVLSSTGDDAGFIETALSEQGRSRRIGLRAPLLASPALLAESDLIAIVGERTAGVFVRYAPLKILDLPFPGPTTVSAMLWHCRFDDAPAHKWLRGLVLRAAKPIKAATPRFSAQAVSTHQ